MAAPGQMKRRIVLEKPPVKTADSFGEPVSDAQPIRYPIWASWREQGGNETVIEGQEVGVTVVTIEFWYNRAFRDISVHWGLVGENGQDYDILSIEELGGRQVQIRLKAVLRS